MSNIKELMLLAADVRLDLVEMIANGRGGHIGGDLSSVDILVSLFDIMKHDPNNPMLKDRDRFILSKGHSAEGYYVLLAKLGYFQMQWLENYGKPKCILGGHPTKKVPGVETNSGALGHGMSVGVGMALAAKMDKYKTKVFVLCGDGEMAEGSNWEAAMAASKFKLNNFCVIVDRNMLQISGSTEDVMPLEPFADKWKAFGFDVRVVNGHNMEELQNQFIHLNMETPTVVIANTIKGKGMPCAENKADWHHKTPNEEQIEAMRKQIEEYKKELKYGCKSM